MEELFFLVRKNLWNGGVELDHCRFLRVRAHDAQGQFDAIDSNRQALKRRRVFTFLQSSQLCAHLDGYVTTHVFSRTKSKIVCPRDALAICEIGPIHSDMQPSGAVVFEQLSLLIGQPIPMNLATLEVPVEALPVSQRLACKVGGQLQHPHRLSSIVCFPLTLAFVFFFFDLLLSDSLHETCHEHHISGAIPDDGSGDVAVAEVLIKPRLEPTPCFFCQTLKEPMSVGLLFARAPM